MSTIAPIQPALALLGSERAPAVAKPASGTDFGDLLSGAIDQARSKEQTATDMQVGFANGDPNVGIHEVMIASEEANISLRYATTLKNKLLEAYRELMNTAV
ncbi:MAG TPA: flagellar hook-basal body complex protein FliE [Kofleriaceae bacterium]|nr:flagellar hook-basal body complex protein FliE [Kofleriaceae bacterium]